MKRVCKQCGTSFELSDSEIAFYKSKNLNLPKRCKECRQANKRDHAVQEKLDWNNVQKQSHDLPARNNHKVGIWVYALIAASILLLLGLIRISNWYFSSNSARPPVTVENRNAGAEEEAGNGNAGTEEEAGNGNAGMEEEAGNGNAGMEEEAGNRNAGAEEEAGNGKAGKDEEAGNEKSGTDILAENDGIEEQPQEETAAAEETTPEKADSMEAAASLQEASEAMQGEADAGSQYTFRNAKLLNEHFEKHGKEMGFSSAEEYLAAANAVVNNASALHKTEKEDGDDVYYLEATNEFVIVSTDGFIRTYFYPNAGIDYYNRQ